MFAVMRKNHRQLTESVLMSADDRAGPWLPGLTGYPAPALVMESEHHPRLSKQRMQVMLLGFR